MGRTNTKRGALTEKERAEIIEKYKNGDCTYQDLANEYQVHKTTIGRICKGQKKFDPNRAQEIIEEAKPSPKIGTPVLNMALDDDPILFRRNKLVEISDDIQETRERGSFHSLPQFHRLHLQVHDEYIQMKRESEELEGLTDPNEVLHQIAIAVAGLPPLLKDKLMDIIEGDYSNIIPFKGAGE